VRRLNPAYRKIVLAGLGDAICATDVGLSMRAFSVPYVRMQMINSVRIVPYLNGPMDFGVLDH